MADRYSYLPDIGLLIGVVFLAADLLPKQISIAIGLAACIALSAMTELQISYWRDSTTLFTHTDQVTRRNFEARAILAGELMRADRVDEALPLAKRNQPSISAHVPVTISHAWFSPASGGATARCCDGVEIRCPNRSI